MKRRLTVHLTDVPKTTKKLVYKNDEGKTVTKTKQILVNTLAYEVNDESHAGTVLANLKSKGMNVTKHYLSNIN